MEVLLLGIASIFVLGIGAQWIAWRFKLPSILLLLVLGFVAGPVTGLVQPELLEGPWFYPLVSVSVGVILFEGGLSLRVAELREVGKIVRNLVSIGVLVTWILSSVAAAWLLELSWGMAIVLGSILVVTGPTVIIPLLRFVRPTGRIGAVAKWEGITIDPIGAILAVLVLEFVVLWHDPLGEAAAESGNLIPAIRHTLQGIVTAVGVGIVGGFAGAGALVGALHKRLVPDFLKNPFVLMVVVGVFALTAQLHQEAGLLATTTMGIVIANQRFVSTRRIIEFKEDIRVLLLGALFIVLSANLDMSALYYFSDVRNLLFLLALLLLVRPVSVLISSIGTNVARREQVFLAMLAPRGIVAAAVASLFGLRLQSEAMFPEEAEALTPLVFMIIVGTVAFYGLTIKPVARRLGLAEPSPEGLLIVGAHSWARSIARLLQELGYRVLMIDTNPRNIVEARRDGIPAQRANVLVEGVIEELDLAGVGRMLALTSNDEVNSLATLHFAELFESAEVYQLVARGDGRQREGELPEHLRGRPLFGAESTFASLSERFARGDTLRTISVKEPLDGGEMVDASEGRIVPLFVKRASGHLHVIGDERVSVLNEDDVLIALIDGAPEVDERVYAGSMTAP